MLVNNNAPIESYETRVSNNIGPVTVTGGQKAGYTCLMIFGGIFTLGIFPATYIITQKNWINEAQLKINEAAATIETQLQQRFDLLNKLVDAVKGQVKFDKETLSNIAAFRSGKNPASDITEKSQQVESIGKSINIAMEAYPELGADKAFARLMNECSIQEGELAAARRNYNAQVTQFNQAIFQFPLNVLAAKQGCVALNLFSASAEARKDVKIDF